MDVKINPITVSSRTPMYNNTLNNCWYTVTKEMFTALEIHSYEAAKKFLKIPHNHLVSVKGCLEFLAYEMGTFITSAKCRNLNTNLNNFVLCFNYCDPALLASLNDKFGGLMEDIKLKDNEYQYADVEAMSERKKVSVMHDFDRTDKLIVNYYSYKTSIIVDNEPGTPMSHVTLQFVEDKGLVSFANDDVTNANCNVKIENSNISFVPASFMNSRRNVQSKISAKLWTMAYPNRLTTVKVLIMAVDQSNFEVQRLMADWSLAINKDGDYCDQTDNNENTRCVMVLPSVYANEQIIEKEPILRIADKQI
ncbi:hypothetical protein A3Q56_05990 [Intoshia linei]|uniref:Uncharacterized protein n=1 Tax=Intoshia linei TaxID=1819745 RepID=A0A177AWQ9_9BILA|nr:hypothetical protein A3Q56_05990 [Intoshia linei]